MATPLSADRVLAALRAEGCTVVEYQSWRTHNRNHKGAWGPVNGVMIHHTVSSGEESSVALCYNGHADLPGPLCHTVGGKSGTLYMVGHGRANHAGSGDGDVLRAVIAETALPADNEANTDGNRHFYGLEIVNLGNGIDTYPAVQYDAAVRWAAALCRAHGWSAASVIGHREWQPGKVDPRGPVQDRGSFDMSVFRRDVAERLKHPASWSAGASAPTTKPPTTEEDPMAGMTKKDIGDAVWEAPVAAPDTAPDKEARPTWWAASYLRAIYGSVTSLQSIVAAQTAAITALAGQVGNGADTQTIVAAVERAIADAVVKVDVDITGPAAS